MSHYAKVICNICLEGQTEASNPVMKSVCGHEFHSNCLLSWTTTKLKPEQTEPNPCPVCRTKLGSNPKLTTLFCGDCMKPGDEYASFSENDFFVKYYYRFYPPNIYKHLSCWESDLEPNYALYEQFMTEFESDLENLIELAPEL